MIVHTIHNRDGCHISRFKENGSFAVYNRIVGTDFAGNKFLHNIGNGRKVPKKLFQLLFVGNLPGIAGADTSVRLHDDRIAHFLNKFSGSFRIVYHMITGGRNFRFFIPLFHLGFVFDERHVLWLQSGCNMKIFPELCILFQPVLVVAFQPVNLSVMEGKKSYCPEHLVIVFHIVYLIIFCQGRFELLGKGIIGSISNAQHIDSVLFQGNTEIFIVAGKSRRNKYKIFHKGLLLWKNPGSCSRGAFAVL